GAARSRSMRAASAGAWCTWAQLGACPRASQATPPLATGPMTDLPRSALDALQAQLLAMPPARAMQLRITAGHADRLRLEAPLAANVNDKGTAFGGSLVSLMTLAAWGLAA